MFSIYRKKEVLVQSSYGNQPPQVQPVDVIDWVRLSIYIIVFIVLFILLMGACGGSYKAYSRYQDRADRSQARQQKIYDEKNNVEVNNIRIAQQSQLVKVAQQQAQIRFENAVGVRKAQDEISSTLTPLYVQFEMIDALKEIAHSGSNNSIVYIPTGDNGVPIVSTTDPTKVGGK